MFSALWSEHCSYKSSKKHLRKFAHSSPRVVSEDGENAGVIDLGRGEKIAFKMESHNHPSRITPFHGAMTGVGGILRDIIAMNARPVMLANYLCFGDPQYSITPSLVEGVVSGIGGYGNCIGIPTTTGQTNFHSSYNENILVNALAVGYYSPSDSVMTSKIKSGGGIVVYAGSRTGRDGIHGASMASESFDDQTQERKSTVQVGDPFYGKLLMESCLSAMKKKLISACQDMGAAGLISSSFEMASKSRLGMNLHLDKIPLRDSTMTPEEILLSETQERMLFICPPENYPKIEKIFNKWELPICILGEVISDRKMNLYWNKKKLASVDPLWFTEHAPVYDRPYKVWSFPNKTNEASKTLLKTGQEDLLEILKHPSACSREFIFNQYDQRVGALTARDCSFPFGAIQLPDSKRFLGLALGGRPYLLNIDASIGGKDSILHPCLQLAVQGFEPLAVTDCLNFGNPEKEDVMSQFSAVVDSMAQACKALDVPVVSGNVSFYNESSDKNIIPAPSTGVVGLKTKWSGPKDFFEKEGSAIYLITLHQCYTNGLLAEIKNKPVCFYGDLDLKSFQIWLGKILSLCREKEVASTRAVGKLGLAYTLFLMTLKGMGAEIHCDLDPFQERLYEVIAVVSPSDQKKFEEKIKKLSLNYQMIGKTAPRLLSYNKIFSFKLEQIHTAYSSAIF